MTKLQITFTYDHLEGTFTGSFPSTDGLGSNTFTLIPTPALNLPSVFKNRLHQLARATAQEAYAREATQEAPSENLHDQVEAYLLAGGIIQKKRPRAKASPSLESLGLADIDFSTFKL